MPQFSNKRRVRHSAAQMFDLVADVEKYPQFVPLCQSLKVKQRTQGADGTEVIVADMTVSFQLVRETFTTQVMLDRANLRILVEYLKGPFSSLENRWAFEPRGESACDVGFFIAYEFRSRMLAALMGNVDYACELLECPIEAPPGVEDDDTAFVALRHARIGVRQVGGHLDEIGKVLRRAQ